MQELRIKLSLMFAWLLLFYNIERYHEPINLASFVYVYAAFILIAFVAIKRISQAPVLPALFLILGQFLIIKWIRGYELLGASLPLTVTEAGAITITYGLAQSIAKALWHFEESVADVFSMHPQGAFPAFNESQAEFYREVRRAREFDRPLTLLSIKSDGVNDSIEIKRMLLDMQQRAVSRYVDARVGNVLSESIRDCDLLAYSDDHYVLLMPEVARDNVDEIVDELTRAVVASTGVPVSIGTASFPTDQVTLTGLLTHSGEQMRDHSTEPDVVGRSDFGVTSQSLEISESLRVPR